MPDFPTRVLLPALAAIALSACTTASIEDVAPVAAPSFPPAPATPGATLAAAEPQDAVAPAVEANALASVDGPRDTGRYPNLNIAPAAAAEQISAQKRAANISELKATQKKTAASTADIKAPDDESRLRKLGRTHAADALKTIEASP